MPMFEIRLPCRGCGKECRATISDGTSSAKFKCASCGQTLLEARSVSGYVYVLSHRKMPGLLKVGFTKRPVAQEVQELNWVSGLSERFVLEASFESSSPEKHTAEIHKRLAGRRVQGMEYFELSLEAALLVARDVIPLDMLDEPRGPEFFVPDPGELSVPSSKLWSCGLCKHQWKAEGTPYRCPLCQSTSIVPLGGPEQTANSPGL
ncbi:MAG: GIY-YIG nuclease family protein [Terriglobia bacterium]|jgi:ribosomal protein S27E